MSISPLTSILAAIGLLLMSTTLPSSAAPGEGDQFQNLQRMPDAVIITTDLAAIELTHDKKGQWTSAGITVATHARRDGLEVILEAPNAAIKKITLVWNAEMPPDWKYLGDAWERAYGDLEWKALDAHRPMPWYFLATDGQVTHGYGVKTGPAALCCWKASAGAVSLTADVRSGGVGVKLGSRTLPVCTVTCRRGRPGETAFMAARAFCKQMCAKPRLPKHPVYGFNDWYCAYGQNNAHDYLRDAAAVAALAPHGANRPFAVIDDGWQSDGRNGGSQWDHTNTRFGSTMAEMAKGIRALDARPGVWYRPLIASPHDPPEWRLSRDHAYLDPTIPAVRTRISEDVRRMRDWGFDLIKHDYSTFDICGQWGFQMGDEMTHDGWTFSDHAHTTAEVVLDLYRCIREAAGGDIVIIGCNTISHLSAGIFELQRIGDDTSGQEWDRTRKMGVNCLAFRAAQHDTFYAVDADCIGLAHAGAVPWEKNVQWLDLLARSGTPLFVSMKQPLMGAEQLDAIRSAFAIAAQPQPLGEPLDWLSSRTPQHWNLLGKEKEYAW